MRTLLSLLSTNMTSLIPSGTLIAGAYAKGQSPDEVRMSLQHVSQHHWYLPETPSLIRRSNDDL